MWSREVEVVFSIGYRMVEENVSRGLQGDIECRVQEVGQSFQYSICTGML